MRTHLVALLATGLALFALPVSAQGHVHVVQTGHGPQELARGQNHPAFVGNLSCGIVDPAGYGMETAHHGPDAGTPGRADNACYERDGVPDDHNPAID
jgi:hypothetical protein